MEDDTLSKAKRHPKQFSDNEPVVDNHPIIAPLKQLFDNEPKVSEVQLIPKRCGFTEKKL